MNERGEWLRRENRNLDEIYLKHNLAEIPWHYDRPDKELIELIDTEKIKPCSALDVGCGAGTDAIYLALKGFTVTAIDVSNEAIKIGEERADNKGVKVYFIAGNFLEIQLEKDGFRFINDRGCFHQIHPFERPAFARKINELLKSKGYYYLRCWSDKEESDKGPHKISKDVIQSIFSKYFDVVEIRYFRFGGKSARGYACFMKKRNVQKE